MKLVNQTEVTAVRFSDEEAVRMICEAGFDGIDYSMFVMNSDDCVLNTPAYAAHVQRLRKIAEEYSVTFEQAHAPFPSFKEGEEGYNAKTFDRIRRAVEITGILGGKVCVVHPGAVEKNKFESNIDFYNRLLPTAKEFKVKIALENMWGVGVVDGKSRIVPSICSVASDFNRYVDALDPEWFTACLDLGHCGLVGTDAAAMIKGMGHNRVTALHIHDNDHKADMHTLPYTRSMNWDSILKALGEIDYSGNFTYEADNFINTFPAELFPACLKFMAAVGRHMIGEIEKFRTV